MSEEIKPNPLDSGEAFEIEMWNPNPTSSRRKDAPIYRLSFEVPEEIHSAFMNAREGNIRLLGYMIVLPDTDEQPARDALAKKIKEPKGPFGKLWFHLRRDGFVNEPNVRAAIEKIRETPNEDPWEHLLHRYFGVDGASLATVSATDIFAKFPQDKFPDAHKLVQQALKKMDTAKGAAVGA